MKEDYEILNDIVERLEKMQNEMFHAGREKWRKQLMPTIRHLKHIAKRLKGKKD